MQDFELENQLATQRYQKALAAQQQSGRTPMGEMVGNRYVKSSPFEHLAEALRLGLAGREANLAKQEIKDLQSKKQTAMADALRTYTDKATGAPAFEAAGPAQQGAPMADPLGLDGGAAAPSGGYTVPARAPDPRGANASLMNAPDAALRQMGMKGMMEMAQQDAAKAQQQQYMNILEKVQDPQAARRAGVPASAIKEYYDLKNVGRDKVQYKDVGGRLVPVTEYGDQPTGVAPLDKTGNPFSDLVLSKDGVMVPNAPLVKVKGQIAKQGASNVSVNTANKPMLTELGKGVGEGITNAWTGAQSAASTLQNVQQMRTGLDKAIVGPGANQRVTLSQIGQVLGVNGKDATEQLENTRMVMQGLARQELSAAGQMKGQGQITESERSILRKAESGQINELTKPELNTLLGALERTATSRINTHNQNLQRLRQDPNASGVAQFMQVDAPTMGGGGGGNAGLNAAVEAEIKRRQGGR
jgi:hypothetical protein